MTNFNIFVAVKRHSDNYRYKVITSYKAHYAHVARFKNWLYTIYTSILATSTDCILIKYGNSCIINIHCCLYAIHTK